MNRLEQIKAKAINKAGNVSGSGVNDLKIPGMQIGKQICPGGPTFEDIFWMINKLEKCVILLKHSEIPVSKLLLKDIEEGK